MNRFLQALYTASMQTLRRAALLDTVLNEVPFILLDLESTGLDPDQDRICEVAVVRLQNGRSVHSLEALIQTSHPIAPDAYAVHKISAQMLRGAPTFAQLAPSLVETIGDGVLVAHNAAFDVCFLNAELVRAGRQPLNNVVIDTLGLARHFLNHDRYNLASLAQRLGVATPVHRAMSDVQALIALFQHLLMQLEPLGVETLADLVRAQGGLLPGDLEPVAHPLIHEALRYGRTLRIAYRTQGGDPIVRQILPIELQATGGLPRLVAFCYLRNARRTFYLDRMAEITWADE
ncbi:MAG: exonuclease domain-containing protein [Herpetosiphon sp.]